MEELSPESKTGGTFSGRELSKEFELQAEIDTLTRDLLRDFYQSFRLSQGETAIQPPLFTLLSEEHQRAGHQKIMAAAFETADSQVDRLMPPRHHKDTDETARANPETGFRAMWGAYAKALQGTEPPSNRSPEMTLDDMIAQDVKYQDQERPNRAEKDDPHESIVREYILGDRLTGSPQLMAVRDHLRSALMAPNMDEGGDWMTERFQELKKSWETNHPDQAFIP